MRPPFTVNEAARSLERSWGTLDALTYSAPPAFEAAVDAVERALAG